MRIRTVLRSLPFIGAAIVTGAGVSPQDAVSNLAAWANTFGISHIPAFLQSNTADNWGIAIGALVFVIGVGAWVETMPIPATVNKGWNLFRKDEPKPPPYTDYDVWLYHAIRYIAFHDWEDHEQIST